MPRLRKLAGACTIASTRAAGVLKGNQKTVSRRSADQAGAPLSSMWRDARRGRRARHPTARNGCWAARRQAALGARRPVRAGTPPGTPRRAATGADRRRPRRDDQQGRPGSSAGRGSFLSLPAWSRPQPQPLSLRQCVAHQPEQSPRGADVNGVVEAEASSPRQSDAEWTLLAMVGGCSSNSS